MTTAKTKVYVSYSWSVEDKTQIVEKLQLLCEERGIKLVLDKDQDSIKYGESISQFMDELIASKHIITIFSRRYLESEFCMAELLGIYHRNGEKDFLKRIHP